MSAPNGSSGRYRVIYSEYVRTALKDLLKRAKAKGVADAVLSALKKIDAELHTHPSVFGEPTYDLHEMHLQARTAVVTPLAVYYAVDEERRLVYILVPIRPLSESGL